MKKPFLFLILALNYLHVSSQTYAWAKSFMGQGRGYSIKVDAAGNVYTGGYFTATTDFDPGPTIYTLSPVNAQGDIFISKLDAAGNLLWAKKIGGSGTDQVFSMVLGTLGDIYITGLYSGAVDFDPGPASSVLSTGTTSSFLLKLNSAGNFVSVSDIGGKRGTGITIDQTGNILITGIFGGSDDFDPGPGTASLTAPAAQSIFVLKLDALGGFIWAKVLGGYYSSAITTDAAGNVFTIGNFFSTGDFDPGTNVVTLTTGTSSSIYDVFISKLDASGNYVWARSMTTSGSDFGNAIAVDVTSNVYITGAFRGSGDLDPGPGTFLATSSATNNDIYISKLDASASSIWTRTLTSTAGAEGCGIELDAYGNVYTSGFFSGTIDFDPGAGTQTLTGQAGCHFISKLDASGNFAWGYGTTINPGGSNINSANDIELDNFGHIYTTGYYNGNVDFNPGPEGDTLYGGGAFVLKYCNAANTNSVAPTICIGTSVQIDAPDAVSYTWTTSGSNATGIKVTPTVNTIYQVNLIDIAGCSWLHTIDQKVDECAGLQEQDFRNEEILIYPNPANNDLTIELQLQQDAELSLDLNDLLGRTVKVLLPKCYQSEGAKSFSAQVNDLKPGIYFVKIRAGDNESFTKLIVAGN